ncbi:hypothetical protein [Methylobacterium nodulans]|nr:hypothetical protein [Methylobacterium nodulans]
MRLDRHLASLMAAMIITIIAFLAPSAVQAHDGHAHHASRLQAAVQIPAAEVRAPGAGPVSSFAVRIAGPACAGIASAAVEPAGDRPDDPGACKAVCCGTMACCATAVPAVPPALPILAFRHVSAVPPDSVARPGIGPDTLPEPPRTLA